MINIRLILPLKLVFGGYLNENPHDESSDEAPNEDLDIIAHVGMFDHCHLRTESRVGQRHFT